ncbi:MAG: nucleoside hydrolase [Chloroflexi bacterium]|nr:nucleoside hydrolase [Chloroflexota bacterium]
MPEPTRVVIDCDTGVDDTMAIFYGLLAPEVDIVALTSVWGNCPVETATQNNLRLLEMMDRTSIPVAMGASKPLIGPPPEFGTGVHGADGQGNSNLPPPKGKAGSESSAELLIRLAHEHPGELTLVPTGPLTNVATALTMDPEIARLYKAVVLMGGAFLARGNTGRFAEANIWHDPEAAQIVFEAGWPVTAVGLDVTDKTLISQEELDRLRDSGTTAGVHMHRITAHYVERYSRRNGRRECTMHDALALAVAVDPSLVRSAPTVRVDVELTGTHTRGMTVGDFRSWRESDDANVTVVLEVDGRRFIDHWIDVLSHA